MNDLEVIAMRIERTDGLVLALLAATRALIATSPHAAELARREIERVHVAMLNATTVNSTATVEGIQEAMELLLPHA